MEVAIVNRSTKFSDADMPALVEALETQVTRDFSPIWGNNTTIIGYNTTQQDNIIPPSFAQIVLLDTSDQAGALGYHDMTPAGMPLGKAFVGDDLKYGVYASQTVSHELLEMLADPSINCTYMYNSTKGSYLLACEVCDPVEDARQAYQISGVWVSDFVYPAWFGFEQGQQYDFTKALIKPQQIATNGYIGKYNLKTRKWGTIGLELADSVEAKNKIKNVRQGSRRYTRFN